MTTINDQLNELATEARRIGFNIETIIDFSLDYMNISGTDLELFCSFRDEFYAVAEKADSINEQIHEEVVVEEEQKYNVKFKVKSSFGTVGIFLYKKGDEVLAGDNFKVYHPKEDEYRLTEQEIRGFQNGDVLFEHFAVKAEELEEWHAK